MIKKNVRIQATVFYYHSQRGIIRKTIHSRHSLGLKPGRYATSYVSASWLVTIRTEIARPGERSRTRLAVHLKFY